MSKMISHAPFGYLKHKLWPKEGHVSSTDMAMASSLNI
jgi:hypothetical protein